MTEQGAGQAAAAGWYPDTQNATLLRYWDGTRWTDHLATRPAAKGGFPKWAIWLIVGVVLAAILLFVAAVPVFLSQRAKAEDTAAKIDVTELGYRIATWYVDNTEAPSVTQPGGAGSPYYFNGAAVGDTSTHNRLGGFTSTDSIHWCVWVTNPEGDIQNWEYSAEFGLEAGSC